MSPRPTAEIYRCPNVDCGCELTLTRGPKSATGERHAPVCICGSSMDRISPPEDFPGGRL